MQRKDCKFEKLNNYRKKDTFMKIISISPVLYQTVGHGRNVTETRNTVGFIGSLIMNWIPVQNKDDMSMELSKVVYQI